MTFNEMEAKIQAQIDDTTTSIDEMIYNSIRYLYNYFALEDWDDSLVTVANQNFIETGLSDVIDVDVLIYNGEQIEKLDEDDFDKIPQFVDNNVRRFYFLQGKIYFTFTPTESDLEVKVLKKYQFSLPETTTELDVPPELLELVELGAISRYYLYLLSLNARSREDLPDVKPDEVRRAKQNVDDSYNYLLNELRNNSNYAL
jgi:hypothetical protein